MKPKLKEWIERYLPAEVLSSIMVVASGAICYRLTQDRILTALVATWCGNIGFFGYILLNDIIAANKLLLANNKRYTVATFWENIRALFMEFGLAEVLDSFVIRPALMYYLPILTGNIPIGILLAKFIADITFYIPAIISYEIFKKRYRKFD
ncbi:MAG TPA: hypothetical protein VN721_14405 [Flavipsychrobacter sp.]|nr:hypothetical protein [Flavipsychrobacter sp.]